MSEIQNKSNTNVSMPHQSKHAESSNKHNLLHRGASVPLSPHSLFFPLYSEDGDEDHSSEEELENINLKGLQHIFILIITALIHSSTV